MSGASKAVLWTVLLVGVWLGGRAVCSGEGLVGAVGRDRGGSLRVCEQNLEELGRLLVEWQTERADERVPIGAGHLLLLRQLESIRFYEEEKLLCPGDAHARFPASDEDRARYDRFDLSSIPDHACSYAVRDFDRFPLNVVSTQPQILACDRNGLDGKTPHHFEGVNAVFHPGGVRFLDRKALGLRRGEPIVVGPDSKHPILSKVVYQRVE